MLRRSHQSPGARGSQWSALAEELRSGTGAKVRFDDGARGLYATDAGNCRQVPIGVVVPKTIEDVVATIAICRRHGAPVLSRGGGTSLAGQTCNTAVVIDWPKHLGGVLEVDALLLAGYPDVFEAADHVTEIAQCAPIGLEGLDRKLLANMRKKRLQVEHLSLLPDGGAFLLVEFGAKTRQEARQLAETAKRRLSSERPARTLKILDDPSEMHQVWDIRESGLGATARVPGEREHWIGWEDSAVSAPSSRRPRSSASRMVARSPESTGMEAFREFKALWDPEGKMNPGKVVDPYPLTSNLRLGADRPPPAPWKTWFRFPEDDGGFTSATLRCVGVGKCRRQEGGVMCPSYHVTGDEQHSTRGRAHLPINVDMATYKAEFNAHYYKGRLRPRPAYSMGLVMFWARLAALAPRLANMLSRQQPFASAAKWVAGLAPQRVLPRFATHTFQRQARNHAPSMRGRRVLLWPDTFNNHFHPETARAALTVLERAGFRVEVPRGFFCCGRPLYDFGMLDTAKWLLRRTLRQLRPVIAAEVPIIVLEPSCAAVLWDELGGLFPEDPLAQALSRQVLTLAEFLEVHAETVTLPRMAGRALLQGHCHQRSLHGIAADLSVVPRMGLEVEDADAGCSGMAGSFGFERGEKSELSRRIGAQGLLAKVRALPQETLVIADGFSCREQVAQETNRRGFHLAEVIFRGWAHSEVRPEAQEPPVRRRWAALAAGAAVAVLTSAVLGAALSRRQRV